MTWPSPENGCLNSPDPLPGTCQDCGQPVTEGQQFFRSDDGIRHALCLFDPAFAKRERELKSKTAQ
jgi:hypothetical protein